MTNMKIEISVALNFVISYLYNKLPRRRIDIFGNELEKGLVAKFQGHWYPEKPNKGSGYRCLRLSGGKVDPVITLAAKEGGLDMADVTTYLPNDLTLWIDPYEVSYRIGEMGSTKVLYSGEKEKENEKLDREVTQFNPEADCFQPIVGDLLTPSPTGPPPALGQTSPVYHDPPKRSLQLMDVATFAQTKFGSTKMKSNNGRRPNFQRLSPTDFAMKQRLNGGGGGGAQQPQRPRSLSPNPPSTLDFFYPGVVVPGLKMEVGGVGVWGYDNCFPAASGHPSPSPSFEQAPFPLMTNNNNVGEGEGSSPAGLLEGLSLNLKVVYPGMLGAQSAAVAAN